MSRLVDHPFIAFSLAIISAIFILTIVIWGLRHIVQTESHRIVESAAVSIVVAALFGVFLSHILAMKRDKDNRMHTLRDRHLEQLRPALKAESENFQSIVKQLDREAYVDTVTKTTVESRRDATKRLLWPHVMSEDLSHHFPEYEKSKQNLAEQMKDHDSQFVALKQYVQERLAPSDLPQYWKNNVSLSVVGKCLGTGTGMTLKISQNGYSISYWGVETGAGGGLTPTRPSPDQVLGFRSYQAFEKQAGSSDFQNKCDELKKSASLISRHAQELSNTALLASDQTTLRGKCNFVALDE